MQNDMAAQLAALFSLLSPEQKAAFVAAVDGTPQVAKPTAQPVTATEIAKRGRKPRTATLAAAPATGEYIPAIDPTARPAKPQPTGLLAWPKYVDRQVQWALDDTASTGIMRHVWHGTSKAGHPFIRCYSSERRPSPGMVHMGTVVQTAPGVSKLQKTAHFDVIRNSQTG